MVSHSSKAAIIAYLTGMQLLQLSVTPEEPAAITAFSGILALPGKQNKNTRCSFDSFPILFFQSLRVLVIHSTAWYCSVTHTLVSPMLILNTDKKKCFYVSEACLQQDALFCCIRPFQHVSSYSG